MTGPRIITTEQMKELLEKFEFHKRGLSEHRDALRSLALDVDSVADDADEAISSLDDATDALSRYL